MANHSEKQTMKIRYLALAAATLCAPALSNPLLAQEEEAKPKKKQKLVESGEADVKPVAPSIAASVGNIKGAKVRSPDGAQLGDISDVVMERKTGKIRLALVSVGGFLGIGDKIVAVPWTALSVAGTDDTSFILDATKGELETAPGVESAAITNASYSDWLKWGDDYFGVNRKRESRGAGIPVADKKDDNGNERPDAEAKAERKAKRDAEVTDDATEPTAPEKKARRDNRKKEPAENTTEEEAAE